MAKAKSRLTTPQRAPARSNDRTRNRRDRSLEMLTGGRELIARKHNWTQGTYARDRNGSEVAPSCRRAVRFCSEGALRKQWGDGIPFAPYQRARVALARAMGGGRRPSRVGVDIVDYNDHPNTTHRIVMAAWDRAIAMVEGVAP